MDGVFDTVAEDALPETMKQVRAVALQKLTAIKQQLTQDKALTEQAQQSIITLAREVIAAQSMARGD